MMQVVLATEPQRRPRLLAVAAAVAAVTGIEDLVVAQPK